MFANMKIAPKLLILILIPILGMAFFAAKVLLDNTTTFRSMRTTQTLVEVSVATGNLTHELQKERGLSAGFLASKGEKFKDELQKQRQSTDSMLKKMQETTATHGSSIDAIKKELDAVKEQVNKLPATRSAVDSQTIDAKAAIGYYTGLISACLEIGFSVVGEAGEPEIAMTAFGYIAFQGAKESVGQLRATLNGVLAADTLDFPTSQRIARLLATEQNQMANFKRYAPPAMVKEYQEFAQKEESFKKTDEMLQTVLDKGIGSGFGIAAETWFSTITAKINHQKAIEDKLATGLIDTSKAKASAAGRNVTISIVMTVVLAAVTLLFGLVIIRGISKPLSELVATLKNIAEGEGDLTRRLPEGRRDETGEVCLWFNRFVTNVHSIISQVSSTTIQVATSSNQLHSTAEQIATGAEEVAAQSATVATASEEMSATSSDIARNCQDAVDGAQQAAATTQKGFEVVRYTVEGIRTRGAKTQENSKIVMSLGERSEQIGAIAATIEDIADQTNLLALNAAIEAARAGEMGRGFAVVADEVRALAERTSRATKEIGDMIRAIQVGTKQAISSMEEGIRETQKGAADAEQLESALQAILSGVSQVTDQIHQISTAAEEQTAVTGEISTNIHQITDVVQQTANGAHETAGAASTLAKLSSDLERLVGRFKL